jgi:hypothetical protein
MRPLLLSLFTLISLSNSLKAELLTDAERTLTRHMSSIVKTSASISGSHVYPWAVCHNLDSVEETQSSVFLSSPMYSRNNESPIYESLIFSWMVKLINQSIAFKVTRAFCSYQIDHFGHCILQGAISIEFKDSKVISFEDVYYDDKCSDTNIRTRENLFQKY